MSMLSGVGCLCGAPIRGMKQDQGCWRICWLPFLAWWSPSRHTWLSPCVGWRWCPDESAHNHWGSFSHCPWPARVVAHHIAWDSFQAHHRGGCHARDQPSPPCLLRLLAWSPWSSGGIWPSQLCWGLGTRCPSAAPPQNQAGMCWQPKLAKCAGQTGLTLCNPSLVRFPL